MYGYFIFNDTLDQMNIFHDELLANADKIANTRNGSRVWLKYEIYMMNDKIATANKFMNKSFVLVLSVYLMHTFHL